MITTFRLLEYNPIPAMRGLTVAQATEELERQQGMMNYDVDYTIPTMADYNAMNWFIRNRDLLAILRASGEY